MRLFPKSSYLLTFAVMCWSCQSVMARAELTLQLGTDVMPPYMYQSENMVLHGGAKRTLDCVFEQLPDYQYQAGIAPWPRIFRMAYQGDFDGWFLYVQNDNSDDFATLSDPLLLESWYWYSLDDISDVTLEDLKDETVLVMNGTYQAIWLQSQGFNKFFTVPSTDSLVRAFLAGRAQHLLVSESVFNEAVARLKGEVQGISQRFVGFIPLGLYITNDFSDDHPNFMAVFNAAASDCRSEQAVLTADHQQALSDLIGPMTQWLASDWIREPLLIANVRNDTLTVGDIALIDQQWIDEVRTGNFELIGQMLRRDLSVRLALIRRESRGVFSELFITDIYGTTIGTSNITSDWYQGDEGAFNAIMIEHQKSQIAPITYDESTRQYLSQVALPIRDEAGLLIGMLVAGVNVENALRGLR